MNIINTLSNKSFTHNGIPYVKNYLSRVSGNKVEVFNCYDNKDILIGFENYDQYTVDGVTFSNAASLQAALLNVLYSRNTLGGDLPEINQDNIIRILYYFIDMQDDIYAIVDKINTGETFTVAETENILFHCFSNDGYFNSRLDKYLLAGLGKGTYGTGGTQITYENLALVYQSSGTAGSENDPSTQTIDFTITGSQTISQWLNTRNPAITIQPQSEGYTVFKGTVNGNDTSYLWVGDAGVYGDDELQSDMSDFQLLDQTVNTTPKPKIFDLLLNEGVSASEYTVAEAMNYRTNLFASSALPMVINTSTTFTIVRVQQNIAGTVTLFIYIYMAGVGAWGYGGEQIDSNDLERISVSAITIADLENDPNTVTVDLGVLTTDDFITAANTTEHDFSDINKAYYFVYVVDGKSYTQRFIGTPGTYGGSGSPFTEDMFATGPTSETPPVPTFQQVTEAGSFTTLPVAVGAPLGNNDAVQLQQLTALKNEAVKGYDLPDDFICFLSSFTTYSIIYKTDTYRTLNLSSIISLPADSFREILKNGNDLILVKRDPSLDPTLLVRLENCKIVDNVLTYQSLVQYTFTGLNGRVHGSTMHKGFMYLSTRPTNGTTTETQIIKVNPKDFTDRRILTLPLADLPSLTTDIIGYGDGLYVLMRSFNTSISHKFIKIKEDLSGYEVVFSWGYTSDDNRRLNGGTPPFAILRDKVYYVAYILNDFNNIRLYVNDLKTGAVLNSVTIPVNQEGLTRDVYYPAHWMQIFNDKLIITSADTTTGRVNPYWKVLRIDTNTLALEEYKALPCSLTDDNAILSNGYMIIAGEATTITSATKIMKIKYNNFNDYTEELSNQGSVGVLNIQKYEQEKFIKYPANLSDFKNDIGAGTVTNLTYTASPTIGTVTNTNGTGFSIPGADTTSAGFLLPADKTRLNNLDANLAAKAGLTSNAFSGAQTIGGNTTLNTDGSVSLMTNPYVIFKNTGASDRFSIGWNNAGYGDVKTLGNFPMYFSTNGVQRFKIESNGSSSFTGLLNLGQFTTGTEPAYIKGAIYFNTTLNKLRIGGATAWETITSS